MKGEPMTIRLWPEAGQTVGAGRDLSYELARRGQFPGAIRLGRKWRVSRPVLERALNEGWMPADDTPSQRHDERQACR